MNHRLWTATGARVLAMMFIVAGVTACGERMTTTSRTETTASNTTPEKPLPDSASPSAVVIGQAPAEPNAQAAPETAQTTSPAGAQTSISKPYESSGRPMEGDNHSHSTLSPTTPQKADGKNTTGAGEGQGRTQ